MNHLLKHRCTIRRYIETNQDGEIQKNWSDLTTDVPCLIQGTKGNLNITPSGNGLEYDAIGFFGSSTDVQPGSADDQKDQIVVTEPATGGTYMVQHAVDEDGMGHHLTVFLKRLPFCRLASAQTVRRV